MALFEGFNDDDFKHIFWMFAVFPVAAVIVTVFFIILECVT